MLGGTTHDHVLIVATGMEKPLPEPPTEAAATPRASPT
jgi:hypothetical protein